MINTRNINESYAVLESANSRRIILPKLMETAGVEADENVRVLKFRFPKTVDGADLTQMQVRINYINSRGEKGQYIVTDLKPYTHDETYVTFSWSFSRLVTKYKGITKFVVCAVKTDSDGTVRVKWNTSLSQIRVLEGLEVTEPVIPPEDSDIVAQLIGAAQDFANSAEGSAVRAEEAAGQITTSFVNPEMFGAKGDGVTDDTAAVQAMFDAGRLCILPHKTYAVHGVKIGSNVNVIGDGATFLYNNLSKPISDSSESYILYSDSAAKGEVNIQGITFDGQNTFVNSVEYETIQGSTVVLNNFEKVSFRNCVFKNSVMDGLFLTDCDKISLVSCTFSKNGFKRKIGVGTYNCLTVYNSASSISVENCDFSECWDEAIRADGYDRLSVSGCKFRNIGQYVLELLPSKAQCRTEFTGNSVQGTGGTCIAIASSKADNETIIVQNNIFLDVGGYNETHDAELTIGIMSAQMKDGSECIFRDNVAEITTNNCKYAFYMQKFGNVIMSGNSVKLTNAPSNGTLISAPGTHSMTLDSNKFESAASKIYILNLYNAAQDFSLVCSGNKITNAKNIVYLPLAPDTVGTVKSLSLSDNISDSDEPMINVVISTGKDKVKSINAANNQCVSILSIDGAGAENFIAVGNICNETIVKGRPIISKISETANSNA